LDFHVTPSDSEIKRMIRQLNKHDRKLTSEEEQVIGHGLSRPALREQCKDVMVVHNIGLTKKIASQYVHLGASEIEDLACYGVQGLMRALEDWDMSRGLKFSTYATWWVRQSVRRAYELHTRLIRLPSHISENYGKVRRIYDKHWVETGEAMPIEELAIKAGMPLVVAQNCWTAMQVRLGSLDAPLGMDEESGTRYAYLPSEDDTPEISVVKDSTSEYILKLINSLPDSQAIAVVRFLGLDGNEPSTHTQTGAYFGVTRQRAHQWFTQGIATLRLTLEEEEVVES